MLKRSVSVPILFRRFFSVSLKELSIIFGTNEKVMLLKIKEIISSLKQYQDDNLKKLLLSTGNNYV